MFTLLSFFACAPKEAVEDPALHACEHVGTSEGTLISGDTKENGVLFPMDGEPYTVTLIESFPSYLAMQVEAAGPAVLFVGTADVVTGLFHGEDPIILPQPAPNDACPEDIPEHFDIDFHTPGTWYLQLGPAAVEDAWISLAEAEGHGHDE